ncbi:MAG: glycosyltransferase family 4 protein [Caldilineaceae bacterium]
MHVLFVTGEYPPMRGGVGAYTAALAQALVEIGVQVSILTATQAQTTVQPDASVTVYPTVARWDWRLWRQVPRLAHTIGASWLHVQYQTAAFTSGSPLGAAINLAPGQWRRMAQRTGYPLQVAWTYHDLLVPYLFPKAGARLRRWITERPAHASELVIATNEGDYQQLSALSIQGRPAKIPIGSNIAVHELTDTDRTQVRRQRGYSEHSLLLGYFGFLNRSKGGLTLVRTLHTLVHQGHDAHLLMIGERVGASDPTNYAYLQEVEALIATLQLQERVQWTGHLCDEEVSRALHLVDVLLMPYNDGASLRRGTLMAGLAHGCAIVTTTPQSPLPELIDGRDLLYIPAEDPQSAAAASVRLVQEPRLRQQIQRSARQQSQHFTWAAIAAQHLAYYESQLVPRSPSHHS